MKRAISIGLFAITAFAVSLGFMPNAKAQVVTCQQVTNSTHAYPYNGKVQYCGSVTSTSGTNATTALADMITNFPTKTYPEALGGMITTNKPGFFLFDDPVEFEDTCEANPPMFGYATGHPELCPYSNPAKLMNSLNVQGSTFYDITFVIPQYTVLFVTNILDYPGDSVKNTTDHELGHWADYWYRAVLSQADAASSATKFKTTELNVDWMNLNLTTVFEQCTSPGNLFTSKLDGKAMFICERQATATISGTVSAGTVKITVTDPAINPTGSPHSVDVQYTVVGTDTPTSIATGLKTIINMPGGTLASVGISSSSSAGVLTLISASGNETTYTRTVTGTESVTLTTPANRNQLNPTYSGDNKSVLQAAFPGIYVSQDEVWAEASAVETLNANTQVDWYMMNGGFTCVRTVINSIYKTGDLPGDTAGSGGVGDLGSPYSFPAHGGVAGGTACPAIYP